MSFFKIVIASLIFLEYVSVKPTQDILIGDHGNLWILTMLVAVHSLFFEHEPKVFSIYNGVYFERGFYKDRVCFQLHSEVFS